jgi:hypothetical protein
MKSTMSKKFVTTHTLKSLLLPYRNLSGGGGIGNSVADGDRAQSC